MILRVPSHTVGSGTNKQFGQNVMTRRLRLVIIASIICVVLTVAISLNGTVSLTNVAEFGTCEFLLGLVAFRWWYQPLYRTVYDYCSPLAIVCTVGYVLGGPGNALSLAYDNQMITFNPGAFEYFQWPMVSAVAGMLFFDVAYRTASRALCERPMHYPFLDERIADRESPVVTALLWVLVATAVNLYLGTKYSLFSQGSVDGSEVDNVLFQSRFALLMIAWAAASSVVAGARTSYGRMAASLLLVVLLPNLVRFLSRQYVERALVCTLFSILLIRRTSHVRMRTLLIFGAVGMTFFVFITSVRSALMNGDMSIEDLETSMARTMFSSRSDLSSSASFLKDHHQNRLSGLELPAAIERSHATSGASWMYGYHNWLMVARSVPRFIWPGKPSTDPEVAITSHFGLQDADQLTVPFGSGYADGGVLGVAIGFALMGVSLCAIQHFVWNLKSAALIYTGSTVLLQNFEQYIAEYPLSWIRCLAVVLLLDAIIRPLAGAFNRNRRRRSPPALAHTAVHSE